MVANRIQASPPAAPAPPPAPANPYPAGTVLANEGRAFTLTAVTLVRYGAGSNWAQKTLPAGAHACDNATFGDPINGTRKVCESLGAPPATPPLPRASAPEPGALKASTHPRFFPIGAVHVPPGGNLQAALDAHPVVSVGDGIYPSAVLRSGKTLIGIPNASKIPQLTVAPGTENFEVKGLVVDYKGDSGGLLFPPSGLLTKNGKTSYINGGINGPGSNLADITFWSSFIAEMDFENTRTARLKILRQHSHGAGFAGGKKHTVHITGTGIDNTIVAINALGTYNGSIFLKGQRNCVIGGNDDEMYYKRYENKASLEIEDSHDVLVLGHGGHVHGGQHSIKVSGNCSNIVVEKSGQQVNAHEGGKKYIQTGSVNGKFCVNSPSFAAAMGVQNISTRPPIKLPPLGPMSAIPRLPSIQVGAIQKDSTAELQAMLDAGPLMKLPPHPVKITRPLRIKQGGTMIRGHGMDKSAIVAAGHFPILETALAGGQKKTATIPFHMFDFAMHEGTIGLQLKERNLQLNAFAWSSIAFVGQSIAGINVEPPFYAIDNGACDNILFQDGMIGIKHVGDFTFNESTLCYIDKFNIYRCTFYDCQPFFFRCARANNLIAVIECAGINDQKSFIDYGHSYPVFFNNRFSHPITSESPTLIVYP